MRAKSPRAFSCLTLLMMRIEAGLMIWSLQKKANKVSQMHISVCIMTSKGSKI